jgi:hypothetical protein
VRNQFFSVAGQRNLMYEMGRHGKLEKNSRPEKIRAAMLSGL